MNRRIEDTIVISDAGGVLRPWLLLAFVLVMCAPAMFVRLDARDSTNTMENVALLSSMETWHRGHDGDSSAWLIPTNNGAPRVNKPPLVVWINLLAWRDLDPGTITVRDLTRRARMMSAAAGLVTIVGIFWLGVILGDRRTATIAALAGGSMFFMQRQSRMASYDIYFTAWSTLSIASALWAMRLRAEVWSKRRSIAGWGLATVALGAAWLSKGPLALAVVGVPLVGAIVLAPSRRSRHLVGLLIMCVMAAVIALPWYAYIWEHVEEPSSRVRAEWDAIPGHSEPPYYYVGLLVLVVPWTLWLIAGLLAPWQRSGTQRRLELVPWMWAIGLLTLFTLSPARQQRYILPAIPAVALLVAQAWRAQESMAIEGRTDFGSALLRNAHWYALLAVSCLAGPLLALQPWFIEQAWLSEVITAPVGWPVAVLLSLVLAVVAVSGLLWHRRHQLHLASVLTAVWAIALMTTFWWYYAEAPSATNPYRPEAERLASIIGDAPLRFIRRVSADPRPQEKLRLFMNARVIKKVKPRLLGEYASEAGGDAFVLARCRPDHDEMMLGAGYTAITDIREDDDEMIRLWKAPAPGAAR